MKKARALRPKWKGGILGKGVACFKDGDFVKWYPSARSAEKDGYVSQNISECALNKRQKHHGVSWVFMERPPEKMP